MTTKDAKAHGNDYQKRIFEAWSHFVAGGEVADGVVPQHILDSWRVCRERGVDPFSVQIPPILSADRFEALKQQHKLLLDAA